jgi:hypothetical protein
LPLAVATVAEVVVQPLELWKVKPI